MSEIASTERICLPSRYKCPIDNVHKRTFTDNNDTIIDRLGQNLHRYYRALQLNV